MNRGDDPAQLQQTLTLAALSDTPLPKRLLKRCRRIGAEVVASLPLALCIQEGLR